MHRCPALPDGDVTVVSGVPCSIGSRAIAECAATMDDRRRIELVDAAIFQRVTPRQALHARAPADHRRAVRPVRGGGLHGLRFHPSPQQVREDAERVNLATQLGLDVLVFTWDQVLDDFGRSRSGSALRSRRPAPAGARRRRP